MRELIKAQWWLLMLLSASLLAAPQSRLKAYVQSSEIEAGQAILFTVQFNGNTTKVPDFSPLDAQFSRITVQQGRESSLVNGNFSEKTTWTMQLIPKSSNKTLTIPSLTLDGDKTEAITITQVAAAHRTDSKDEVSLKVYTDHDQVYLGGQLIVNVEVKTSLSLRNGSLDQLELKNCIVEPLIEDAQSEVIENGIQYRVFKRSYAVFPNRVGTLIIPALNFAGMAMPQRENGWPGFFSAGSRVVAHSQDIKVKVLDVPESYPKGEPFLPVKNLVVIESIEDQAKFEVNRATTRRFEIKADGALSTFLPTLTEPSVKNLQIYSEDGEKTQNPSEDGMIASHKLSQVYMPLEPGPMVIPEQIIYWWDTEKNELRTTVVRELAIDVTGTASASPKKNVLAPVEKPILPKAEPKESLNYWVILGIVFGVLLVLAGLYAFQKRKEEKSPPKLTKKQELNRMVKEVIKACDKGDLRLCYVELKKLLLWPNLSDVDGLDELKALMIKLEKELYHTRKESDKSLLLKIKKHLNQIIMKKDQVSLDPIYPH